MQLAIGPPCDVAVVRVAKSHHHCDPFDFSVRQKGQTVLNSKLYSARNSKHQCADQALKNESKQLKTGAETFCTRLVCLHGPTVHDQVICCHLLSWSHCPYAIHLRYANSLPACVHTMKPKYLEEISTETEFIATLTVTCGCHLGDCQLVHNGQWLRPPRVSPHARLAALAQDS